MPITVKICGLKTPEMIHAAVAAGADMVGFVFFEKTPRFVTPETVRHLAAHVPPGIQKVGLVVDASDDLLRDAVEVAGMDILQLHGKEPPERVSEVRALFGRPVMKALGISTADDVQTAKTYEPVSDRLLFDAKPPKDADRPGGNAESFDWRLLTETAWEKHWLLAGGLTPENVADAIQVSRAPGVDVSSGVEDAPGKKNAAKIRAFVAAARGLQ